MGGYALPPGATSVEDQQYDLPPGARSVTPPAAPTSGFDTQHPVRDLFQGAGDVVNGLWKAATGVDQQKEIDSDIHNGNYGHAALKILQHSIPGYDTIVAPAIDQATKAVDYAKHGRYSEAVGHGVAALTPGLGPLAANITDTAVGEPEMPPGQQMQEPHPGQPYRAAGQVLTTAAIPLVAKGVSAGAGALFKADPVVAGVRAFKPTPSDSGFIDRLPDTFANIKAANGGASPESMVDVIPAVQKAIKNHSAAFERWMDPARQRNTQVSGDPIVAATRAAIPLSMILEDPEAAQGIVDQAQAAYGGKTFTVDEIDKLRGEKNAELDSFYDKSTGKQQASVTSGSPQAVVKAQRDAIADSQYRALDPQNDGAGPRTIKSQTGDMIDILDAANRQKNASIAEHPISAAESIGKPIAKVADIGGKLFHGKLEEGVFPATRDTLIKRAFDAVGDPQQLPTPNITPYNPRAGQMGSPQLNPGPVITPPPADTSGPIEPTLPQTRMLPPGAAEVPGLPANRQLPAPPIVTPPPADTSGIVPGAEPRPGAGLAQQVGERQLPPASGPIQQPGTAVQDMVPIQNPDTGEVTYHSAATLRDLRNLGGTPGTIFEKPTGVKFTVKAVDPAKNTTTYDMENATGAKTSRTQPTSVFQKLVADAKTTPPPQPATPPAGPVTPPPPEVPPVVAVAPVTSSNTGTPQPITPQNAPAIPASGLPLRGGEIEPGGRPTELVTEVVKPGTEPPTVSAHKVGDTVNLRGVGKVTIKAINPDGSFDY